VLEPPQQFHVVCRLGRTPIGGPFCVPIDIMLSDAPDAIRR
jgi:hypothetical protein